MPPQQTTDYLALVGDASDNVPGVRGIGHETAVALLQAHGDLEHVLARREELVGRRTVQALVDHIAAGGLRFAAPVLQPAHAA